MEDVRAVQMNQDARVIEMVVGVPAHVRASVDDEHACARGAREPFGDDAPGEPGADDQHVVGGRHVGTNLPR